MEILRFFIFISITHFFVTSMTKLVGHERVARIRSKINFLTLVVTVIFVIYSIQFIVVRDKEVNAGSTDQFCKSSEFLVLGISLVLLTIGCTILAHSVARILKDIIADCEEKISALNKKQQNYNALLVQETQ